MVICKCFGPLASAVMNGRLMSVDCAELSSFLAFSQASWSRCRAIGVLAQVDAVLLLELVGHVVDQHWSKSSPPRWVSPLVLMTRNTPSATSSTETSNVPPPRSKTTIFSFFFLSRP